jgi:hypothetical protein
MSVTYIGVVRGRHEFAREKGGTEFRLTLAFA